jgi:hypothetical protein
MCGFTRDPAVYYLLWLFDCDFLGLLYAPAGNWAPILVAFSP